MNEEEKNAINFFKKLEFDEYEWWYDGEEYETREETEIVFEKAQKTILNLIDKQQEEIEELKRDYEIITDDMKNHNVVYTDMPEFEERYISKDKIRDKIEQLEKEKDLYFEKQIIQGKINLLKELLGEKNNE